MAPKDDSLDTQQSEERLCFERLLTDLSSRFISLPADQVDDAIVDVQRRVCECLGLDLAVLWQWEVDAPGVFMLTHHFRRVEGGPPISAELQATVDFPWSLGQVLAGRKYLISSMDEFPEGAERDVQSWRYFGIKTVATFPLSVGHQAPFGAVSFHDTVVTRNWSELMVKRLELVADIFANAIVRKRAEQNLRHSEERLTLATEAAEAGLWELDMEKAYFWVTRKTLDLFGMPSSGDALSVDAFIALVHGDDQQRLRVVIEQAVRSQEMTLVEYRIVRPDGQVRWMQSRGRMCGGSTKRRTRLMGITSDITERKQAEMTLEQALAEVHRLRDQLHKENVYLREQVRHEASYGTIVGESEPVLKMLSMARKVAPTDSTVLITGETGTGKELLAQAIHDQSPRHTKIMVKVNCAALPAPLIEGELFGREKGAYTGALTQQAGRFEIADGSTLFLDEIGDLAMELQTKLLRVLQDGKFERLGSHRTLKTDVRVIAATNRDLGAMIKDGAFREDLFHRLNVFPIQIPPLRERVSDIPLLVWEIVQEFNAKMGRSIESIPKPTMERLKQYSWPGNIREMRNVIERAMIVSDGRILTLELPNIGKSMPSTSSSLQDVERDHILDVLEKTGWRISGKQGAAEILKLVPTTLHSRMKKLGISRPAKTVYTPGLDK